MISGRLLGIVVLRCHENGPRGITWGPVKRWSGFALQVPLELLDLEGSTARVSFCGPLRRVAIGGVGFPADFVRLYRDSVTIGGGGGGLDRDFVTIGG